MVCVRHSSLLSLLVVASLSLAAVTVWTPPARAQSAEQKSKARGLFDEGQSLYAAGEFANARDKFEAAYEIYPLKAFLFNIAQCHFQLERYDDATWFYKEYLKDNADAPNADIVQEYIIQSETRAEAERQKAKADKSRERADRAAEERQAAEKAAAEAEAEAKRADIERKLNEKRAADAERRRAEAAEDADALTNQWWFFPSIGGAVAVGAVLVVGAIAAGTTGTVVGLLDRQASQGSVGTIDGRSGGGSS